jgi:hypothetical protein
MLTNQFDHNHDPDPEPLQANNERTYASERLASSPRTLRSQLGSDFQPSRYSVICGRGGKASYDHPGNYLLRMLASTFVADYSPAGRKLAKSAIVANIVAVIRQQGGHFCKFEKGAWFEVGDYYAREKVSASFRDSLHTDYRSSANAKIARRRAAGRKQDATQTQQYDLPLIDMDTGHSMSSSCSGSSTDSLGFDHSTELDFFDIDVF